MVWLETERDRERQGESEREPAARICMYVPCSNWQIRSNSDNDAAAMRLKGNSPMPLPDAPCRQSGLYPTHTYGVRMLTLLEHGLATPNLVKFAETMQGDAHQPKITSLRRGENVARGGFIHPCSRVCACGVVC